MLNKATTLIIIVLLIISACEKTEDSKAPDNSFVVFSSDGIEKSTKDKGFIFLSGKDTNIKLEHFDRKGKKLWRCDLGNYLTQYPKYKILNFCETNEGGIVGLSNYSDTMYDVSYLKMFKIDSRGKFLWERTVALDVHWVPEYTGLINDGKDNYISSFFTWSTGLSSGFIKIDSTGRLLYYQNSNLITVSIMNISDDHLFAVANDYDFSNGTFVYKFGRTGV